MHAASLLAVFALAPTLAFAQGSADVRAETLARAARELESSLRADHPKVTEWNLRSLLDDRSLQAWPDSEPSKVEVTRRAARSAVRLTWNARPIPHVRTAWFEVSGSEPMLVATRDLPPNAMLSPADAELADRDIMGISCSAMTTSTDLESTRTKRAFRRGAAICLEALEKRPDVARGEDVVVQFSSPKVSIVSSGIAQADAQIGQSVYVVSKSSRDAFLAVVSAVKEVVVHE
jgi:flagella basal body P-ring formation protein FlgA